MRDGDGTVDPDARPPDEHERPVPGTHDPTDPLEDWFDRPALRPLLRRLLAGGHAEALAAAEAEVAVARRLLDRGAEVRVEIPTPDGRHCDFEVRFGNEVAYLHVKRSRGAADGQALRISPHLAALERIERSYVVSVWWVEHLDDDAMRRLIGRASRFVRDAKVGDEMRVRSTAGRTIGGCAILAPTDRRRVSVVIGLPRGFHDRTPRIHRLLRKAHRQFMPGAANAVLVCGDDASDALAVETALLGSHVERWDRLPPRGTRVAHGRADDGFWNGSQRSESRIAGWFRVDADGAMRDVRLWFRDAATADGPIGEMLRRLLLDDRDHEGSREPGGTTI